ncbi:similar to Saccharomyces cerevisiae YKR035W-A DID2 Class E protein of the vacuolar protein-sorting (Vps) pathway [Maudiozyma barnettii]|uniref:Similar to Saccharomyces cerevisiae YKR035W-A DID2 Class E protein of the vacuolar protein-sorting (Vps) pathway n=1 Tax=Maudiozyma barnettii TaxID=61262 RepID=A0A8H2ZJV3_9SACH|nr:Did2p [Kazachstania barnettii]CAB4254587.1 similar to Saccharomyces cerevisiae YKR035W-A DID2 Class E protein of the vacuolar protein-sorting (Vps) pathway [Kazachstania barnettii]CAD1782629.1 similar to Saccharomyces cerevisiae YKR035W-A DID2 Class E protein of the vacuolar protein-sorting (Vps) pathway [Kazachstania barnettii]
MSRGNPSAALENTLFQLKFTAKQLKKQSQRAAKEETQETNKLKKALNEDEEIAKIYASNAIRKKNERLQLLKLASRVDSVASRVQTAVTMRAVSSSMANVCRGMDKALASMNLEQITMIMDKFEKQFEDLDVSVNVYEKMGTSSDAVMVDNDKVDELMAKVADENGMELKQSAPVDALPTISQEADKVVDEEKEDKLAQRLRALRG